MLGDEGEAVAAEDGSDAGLVFIRSVSEVFSRIRLHVPGTAVDIDEPVLDVLVRAFVTDMAPGKICIRALLLRRRVGFSSGIEQRNSPSVRSKSDNTTHLNPVNTAYCMKLS